ncbi:hypothetical protein DFJ77DRAFT_472649 [Powellomyces hirtus]|nr:hypothetical protein DFJ77DRAFT_472649 [Powellomyces hirtus]
MAFFVMSPRTHHSHKENRQGAAALYDIQDPWAEEKVRCPVLGAVLPPAADGAHSHVGGTYEEEEVEAMGGSVDPSESFEEATAPMNDDIEWWEKSVGRPPRQPEWKASPPHAVTPCPFATPPRSQTPSHSASASPVRKRSTDIDRANAVAAIGPAGIPTDTFPTASTTATRPISSMPLRRLSFGKDFHQNASPSGAVHVIRKSDTLAGIAVLHRVTVAELKAANRLWNELDFLLRSHLIIPKCRLTPSEHPPGDVAGSFPFPDSLGELSRSRLAPATESPSVASTTSPRPTTSTTTEAFLASLDRDIAATLSALGHTPPDVDAPRIGRVFPNTSNRRSAASTPRHTIGSWDNVLPCSTAAKNMDHTSNRPITWISSKLKHLRDELLPAAQEPQYRYHHPSSGYARVQTTEGS